MCPAQKCDFSKVHVQSVRLFLDLFSECILMYGFLHLHLGFYFSFFLPFQFLPGGTVCRASTNECDLPEYCNGTSQFCQQDVTVQNGYPCQNDEAYCYNGVCQYYEAQCQAIFGSSKDDDCNVSEGHG